MKNAKKTELAEIISLNFEPIGPHKGISETTFKVGVETLQSQSKIDNKWLMFTDLLMADKVTADRLKKDKAEEEKELHRQINQMIYRSFGKYGTARKRPAKKGMKAEPFKDATGKAQIFTWEEIMRLDTKTLSEADAKKKREKQMQRGARFSLIRSHMEEAERKQADLEKGTDKGNKGSKTRTTRTRVERLKKQLSGALEILRNWGEEGADFDITQAVAELTKTYNSIK